MEIMRNYECAYQGQCLSHFKAGNPSLERSPYFDAYNNALTRSATNILRALFGFLHAHRFAA